MNMEKEARSRSREYTKETLKTAIEAWQSDQFTTLAQAARFFGIPESTLRDKLSGRTAIGCKKGPPPVLLKACKSAGLKVDFEALLHDYLIDQARRGFPLNVYNLRRKVFQLLEAERKINPAIVNPFPAGGIPGKKWVSNFFQRHPDLVKKVSEHHSISKATVTEKSVRFWFENVLNYLRDEKLENVLEDPNRVFNADETPFNFCLKTGTFIGVAGESLQHIDMNGSGEKENLTVMLTVSASGEMMPPTVIFTYQRFPSNLLETCPTGWQYLKSTKGWMESHCMLEYVKHFHAHLVGKGLLDPSGSQQKVLLFLDGCTSHLDVDVSEYCQLNGIVLICLIPNTTHMLQPLDIGINGPLKKYWGRVLQEHRLDLGTKITKFNIAPKILAALGDISASTITNSFRKCGLYPFNPDAVDYSALISFHINQQRVAQALKDKAKMTAAYDGFLAICKQFLLPDTFYAMKAAIAGGNELVIDDANSPPLELFHIWKQAYEFMAAPAVLGENCGSVEESEEPSLLINVHTPNLEQVTSESPEVMSLELVSMIEKSPVEDEREEEMALEEMELIIFQNQELWSPPSAEDQAVEFEVLEPENVPPENNLTSVEEALFTNEVLPHLALADEEINSENLLGDQELPQDPVATVADETINDGNQVDLAQPFAEESNTPPRRLLDVTNLVPPAATCYDISPESASLLKLSELPERKKRKRRIFIPILSTEKFRESRKKPSVEEDTTKKQRPQKRILTNSADSSELPGSACKICKATFLTDLQNKRKKLDINWLQCSQCQSWWHFKCVGTQEKLLNPNLPKNIRSRSAFDFFCCSLD